MIRLIWDDCTPTRDRRPTTAGDIYDDIHIKEFSNKEELLDELKDICDIWDEEEWGLDELNTVEEKIEQCIGYLDDPGDGSPNILYLNIDGEEKDYDGIFPYDCLEDLDLLTCSEEDVKKAIINDSDEVEDEDDDDSYYDAFAAYITFKDGTQYSVGDFESNLYPGWYDTEEEAIENIKKYFNNIIKDALAEYGGSKEDIESIDVKAFYRDMDSSDEYENEIVYSKKVNESLEEDDEAYDESLNESELHEKGLFKKLFSKKNKEQKQPEEKSEEKQAEPLKPDFDYKEGKLQELAKEASGKIISAVAEQRYLKYYSDIITFIIDKLGVENNWDAVNDKFVELGGDFSKVNNELDVVDFICAKTIGEANGSLDEYYAYNDWISIDTGLTGEFDKSILDSLLGQLSDGLWENSPRMERYWKNLDVELDGNRVVIKTPEYFRGLFGYNSGPEGEQQVKKFFATHLKQFVKQAIEWGWVSEWSRTCEDTIDGFHDPNTRVKDVYRVYDKLLGRKDRISKDESLNEDIEDDIADDRIFDFDNEDDCETIGAYLYDEGIFPDELEYEEGEGLTAPMGCIPATWDSPADYEYEGDVAWNYSLEDKDYQDIADLLKEFIDKDEKYKDKKFTGKDLKEINSDAFYKFLKDKFYHDAAQDAWDNYEEPEPDYDDYDDRDYDYDRYLW